MIYLITALVFATIPSKATLKLPSDAECSNMYCTQQSCPGAYTPQGSCCPICPPDKCSLVDCAGVYCGDNINTIKPNDQCCDICPPDCSNVRCAAISCESGFTEWTPEGACCATCILDCRLQVCTAAVCESGQIKITPDDSCCPICIDVEPVETMNCDSCPYKYFDGCNDWTCDSNGEATQDGTAVCDTFADPYCIQDCRLVKCGLPTCPTDTLYTPDGECCQQCDCSNADCDEVSCEFGTKSYIPDDSCCPQCEIGCDFITCPEPLCADGFEYTELDGQCCGTCEPIGKEVNCETCGTSSYNNGCQTCTCDDQGIETCDNNLCFWEGIPSCIEDETPINCETCGTLSYSDGCNECTCDEFGNQVGCTKRQCEWEGIPECIADDNGCIDPVGMEYKDCGTACPNICGQDTPMMCTQQCVQECQCKDSLYYSPSDGLCVDQTQCPKTCETGEILVGDVCVTIDCDNCKVYNDGCNTCTCGEMNDAGEYMVACTEMACIYTGLAAVIGGRPKCTACYDGDVLDDGICVEDDGTVAETTAAGDDDDDDNCPLGDSNFKPLAKRNIGVDIDQNNEIERVCYFCQKATSTQEFCESVADMIGQFERTKFDIEGMKDCVIGYCGKELGCDFIAPRDDWATGECNCEGIFECARINGGNKIGFMIGIGFAMVVFGWM